jgi:transcriptional regulator with XRE-family HTH domain
MTEFRWISEFGRNFQGIMQDAGFTQKQLARATGISEASISNYIHGTTMPKITAIVNIAYALECSVDDLVDFGSRIDI